MSIGCWGKTLTINYGKAPFAGELFLCVGFAIEVADVEAQALCPVVGPSIQNGTMLRGFEEDVDGLGIAFT